jgi:hypothetical protein
MNAKNTFISNIEFKFLRCKANLVLRFKSKIYGYVINQRFEYSVYAYCLNLKIRDTI